MQFSWNGPLAETHVPRMLFDDTILWRGIHVLDLLPTQLAPADARQAGADGSNRNRTAAMAVWKPSARPNIPVTSLNGDEPQVHGLQPGSEWHRDGVAVRVFRCRSIRLEINGFDHAPPFDDVGSKHRVGRFLIKAEGFIAELLETRGHFRIFQDFADRDI